MIYNIEHGRLSLNGFIEVGMPTTSGSSRWYCSVYAFKSHTACDTWRTKTINDLTVWLIKEIQLYQNTRLVQFKLVLFNGATHHGQWILCICRHFWFFSLNFLFLFFFVVSIYKRKIEMWKRSSSQTHTHTHSTRAYRYLFTRFFLHCLSGHRKINSRIVVFFRCFHFFYYFLSLQRVKRKKEWNFVQHQKMELLLVVVI